MCKAGDIRKPGTFGIMTTSIIRRTIFCFSLGLFIGMGVPADARGQVSPDDRVRITLRQYPEIPSAAVVGVFDEARGDTLYLRSNSTDDRPYRYSLDSVESIEVSSGSRRFTRRGALIGSLSLGGILGLRLYKTNNDFILSDSEAFIVGLTTGGVTGAILGAVIGRFVSREQWTPVTLHPRIGVSAVPYPGRGGGISVRIGI